MLGDRDQALGRREQADRSYRQKADRARPHHDDDVVLGRTAAKCGVDAAGKRLNEHRGLI